MQEVEGSTPTEGTCPNNFSDPIGQDIRTQWALSWKLVVSEWRPVIAVSLNVGAGVRLIKPAKLYMCTQNTTNTTRTDARRRVCAAMVPYRWATRGTSLRELEYTRKLIIISLTLNDFSCGTEQIPCRFCSKSLYKSHFQERCIFPHNLEQCIKTFDRTFVEK